MSYDKSKDQLIRNVTKVKSDNGTEISIDLMSYDGGSPKIRFSRFYNGGPTKLGRFSWIEIHGIWDALGKSMFDDTFAPDFMECYNTHDFSCIKPDDSVQN